MELTYFGNACVRLKGSAADVVVDPPHGKAPAVAKLKPNLLVRTKGDADPSALRPRDGVPQEVAGAGEFQLGGVSVKGIPVDSGTVMRIDIDGVRVVSMAGVTRQLSEEETDDIGRVDILLIGVGGGSSVMDASEARKAVNAIEPGVVVPVQYRAENVANGKELDPVDKFAKEMGLADGAWAAQPKLSLSGSLGETEDTRVVIVEPRT